MINCTMIETLFLRWPGFLLWLSDCEGCEYLVIPALTEDDKNSIAGLCHIFGYSLQYWFDRCCSAVAAPDGRIPCVGCRGWRPQFAVKIHTH